MTSYVGVTHQ